MVIRVLISVKLLVKMMVIRVRSLAMMMVTVKTSDICGNCGPDILIFLSGGLVQSDI